MVPQRVDKDGRPYPTHHQYRSRSRRSLTHQWQYVHDDSGAIYSPPQQAEKGSKNGKSHQLEPGDWGKDAYYKLQAFGQHLELQLLPNREFIAPSLVIQHLDINTTWLSKERDVGLHCFHSGKVAGDPDSMVAVSLCNHMVSHYKLGY